jgi:hypothetical protein
MGVGGVSAAKPRWRQGLSKLYPSLTWVNAAVRRPAGAARALARRVSMDEVKGPSTFSETLFRRRGSREMREDRLARAHVHSWDSLNVEADDHTVLDDRCITLRPQAQADACPVEFETHGAGEVSVPVRQHEDLVLRALGPTPCIHDPGVVDCDARYLADTLVDQLVGVADESRQMDIGATRCERPGNAEEDNPTASECLSGTDRYRAFGAHGPHLDVRDLVTHRNRHFYCSLQALIPLCESAKLSSVLEHESRARSSVLPASDPTRAALST